MRVRALAIAFVLVLCLFASGYAQTIEVGVYSDPKGQQCAMDFQQGEIGTLYVVVTSSGPILLSGVRFALPVPPCAQNKIVVLGNLESYPVTFGDVEDGIAIGLGTCQYPPITVMSLEVLVQDANIPEGCEWKVVADPYEATGEVVVTDCAMAFGENFPNLLPALGRSVILNGCVSAVDAAYSPLPADHAVGVPLDQKLAWSMPPHFDVCAAGCVLSYNIFFGTDTAPPLVASVASPQVVDPGVLTPLTTYYWRVDVEAGSALAVGTLWNFTTADLTATKETTWGGIKAMNRGSSDNEE